MYLYERAFGSCCLVGKERESLWLLLCDAAAMLHQEPLALVLVGWVGKMLTLCESLSVGTVDMDPWDHVRLCLCLE